MRIIFAAAVCACTWGFLAPASAAELTDLASSFEKDKPFGFKLGVSYEFSYKTAAIDRESEPFLQSPTVAKNVLQHFGIPAGGTLQRTETVPDLLYTQRKQTMSIDLAIGLFQDLQLGISLPLVLRDERQYDLDPNAGFNQCATGDWTCVAASSSTYLDGIYPIQPADQTASGSTIFRPPVRGGSGMNMLDTINLSLMGAPVSQRRDPTKPTWTIGFEAQVSIGTIMAYDNTGAYLDANQPSQAALIAASNALHPGNPQQGWNGVSDGLHRFIFHTALSHKFRYVDPYFGLWYMYPLPRTYSTDGSPWTTNYGFAQTLPSPQQQAGAIFGFEATPLENMGKGHALKLDFRAGLQFHFEGRGYSEAWELLASSNALICDDATPLPPSFTFTDPNSRPGTNGAVTQGYFNPACRTPTPTNPATPDPAAGWSAPRLPDNAAGTAYYQQPYNGVTLIENYLTFNAELGVVVELFHHARLRLSAKYLRDQGHIITLDDAGTTSYPDNNRLQLNNAVNNNAGCDPSRVDLKCPFDWNPAYRASIDLAGRRYRVDDVNMISGSAMLQAYW
jgi:hypothetical protein